jgi:hypothetical protein
LIVSFHVATGAAAGAVAGTRRGALALGLLTHLAGDFVPHQDIDSRRFEFGSGVTLVALLLRRAARQIPR